MRFKVLFLVENNSYPQDFRVRREALALRDAGCNVSVIAPRGKSEAWAEVVDSIHIYRFPAPPAGKSFLGYAFEYAYATLAILILALWVAIRRGVDVVHAANPPDTLAVVAGVLKLFGKRFVFDQHDLCPEIYLCRTQTPARLPSSLLRLLERLSYSLADVVIVTNQSYKEIALSRGRVPESKVFIVRNGPPLSYTPMPPIPELRRSARYLIGYVGTIGPQDGLDYWMRAIREIRFTLKRSDFVAVVIGDGDALPSVRALSETLGIASHVLFTGRLPESDARRLLSSVDVCVQPDPLNPLNDKSTMNKLMEYMALGKACVAFDLVETRVSAADAALYAHANDEFAFASHVVWLLDHPQERRRMGEIGSERIERYLAWEYSIAPLTRAYTDGLAADSSCPRPLSGVATSMDRSGPGSHST
jgi:glycosyltransferase involved in cell wall biosynthesis